VAKYTIAILDPSLRETVRETVSMDLFFVMKSESIHDGEIEMSERDSFVCIF
jgi:hypothetical protein